MTLPGKEYFQTLKTLDTFMFMEHPYPIAPPQFDVRDSLPEDDQMVLRMLVRTKYGEDFIIPPELEWLRESIEYFYDMDTVITGIERKWAYVTVRHGVEENPDNTWHMDGGSLRVELIPERNYIWVSDYGFLYRLGCPAFPKDFDPVKQNMFSHIRGELGDRPTRIAEDGVWHLLTPNVFHQRNPDADGKRRTFIRITFPDIEIRDVNCTQNSLLPTEAFGRDPVKSFRSKLKEW